MSGKASVNIGKSKISEFICSDSLITKDEGSDMDGKLKIISTAFEIADAIISINVDGSIAR